MQLGTDKIKEENRNGYHAYTLGSGPPMLFFPAFGFSGLEGLNIAEALAADYECHLLDIPGMGRSRSLGPGIRSKDIADWVVNYLDMIGYKQAVLIGHSIGGTYALMAAIHYPDRVKSLVLIDQCHKRYPRFPTADMGSFGYLMPLVDGLARLMGPKVLTKLGHMMFADENEDKEDTNPGDRVKQFCQWQGLKQDRYIEIAFEDDVDIHPNIIHAMFLAYRLHLRKILHKVEVPTLAAYATLKTVPRQEKESQRTEKEVSKLIKAANPSIQLLAYDTGHYIHWSDPQFMYDLCAFLQVEAKTQQYEYDFGDAAK